MKTLRFPLLFRLALRDLSHGWQATACLVVAVAVALTPLLLLYGLKFGVVTNLISSLREDPRVLEITLTRDQALSADWFAELGADPRVDFLLPRARYLASSVRMSSPNARSRLDVRMIPTAPGDPMLDGLDLPEAYGEIVLTERTKLEAKVEPGDSVTLDILRTVDDQRERVSLEVEVIGVIPRDRLQRDDIFVSTALESAIERWREGFAVPELDWPGAGEEERADAGARTYASFRLYANDVRDVPGLRDRLLRDGLVVETRAEDVEQALAIEAGLGWVFTAISTLSVIGFLLTFGLHLAASVVEKSRELSVLCLLGLRSREMSLMPSLQGAVIAILGSAIACVIARAAQPLLNETLDGLAGLTGEVSRLQPDHFAIAVGATVLAGALAGSAAGWRAARLEPSKGLRSD